MNKIIIASNNEHKIKEFKQIFNKYQVLSLKDIGFYEEIEENGKTFLENSLIKARTISLFLKNKGISAAVLADDSGLCVNALNGEPGIYSARYSGKHGDGAKNRAKVLKKLEGIADRSAYFNCVLVKYFEDGTYIYGDGKTHGQIMSEEHNNKTFGYDCIFFSDDIKKPFSEASMEEKNKISHRGRAVENLIFKEKNLTKFLEKDNF